MCKIVHTHTHMRRYCIHLSAPTETTTKTMFYFFLTQQKSIVLRKWYKSETTHVSFPRAINSRFTLFFNSLFRANSLVNNNSFFFSLHRFPIKWHWGVPPSPEAFSSTHTHTPSKRVILLVDFISEIMFFSACVCVCYYYSYYYHGCSIILGFHIRGYTFLRVLSFRPFSLV